MRPKKDERAWRDEFVPKDELQCACGCALQLSKGDLTDAIRVLSLFGGKPRRYGVDISLTPQTITARKLEADEPVEREPCGGCRIAIVELPVYAANMLRAKKADWPRCPKCRERAEREARERKEPPRQTTFASRPKKHWREVLGDGMKWPQFGNEDVLALARRRHRELIQKHHPDKGGDAARAAEINVAMQEAEEELS